MRVRRINYVNDRKEFLVDIPDDLIKNDNFILNCTMFRYFKFSKNSDRVDNTIVENGAKYSDTGKAES